MNPMEQAFLADILEHPDDDTPRLIYADWLDEHGDADRAELIRVQCELEKGRPRRPAGRRAPPGFNRAALRRRERELLRHWKAWVPFYSGQVFLDEPPGRHNREELAGYIGVRFRRGFVEGVTCSAAAWLARGDAIRRAQPVTRVTLTTWPLVGRQRAPGHYRCWLNGDPEGRLYDLDDLRKAPAGRGVLRRLLAVRFPGITFQLPTAATS
jgi:uncharacterized protein (TIGR02996 family)